MVVPAGLHRRPSVLRGAVHPGAPVQRSRSGSGLRTSGLCPGKAAGNTAVCQRLQEEVDKCGATAGDSAACVNEGFWQRVQPSCSGEQSTELLYFPLGHAGFAVENHTFPDGGWCVWHHANYWAGTAGQSLNGLHRQAGGHGYQYEGVGRLRSGSKSPGAARPSSAA